MHARNFFIAVCFGFPAFFSVIMVQAQTPKRTFIGVSASPDYCYRGLSARVSSSSADQTIRSRNEREMGRLGYHFGVNLGYRMTGQLALETGLEYASKGFRTTKQQLIYEQPNTIDPSQVRYDYAFQYVSIPAKITVMLGKNSVRFISTAGVSADLLAGHQVTTALFYPNGTKKKVDQDNNVDYRKFNISSTISAGIGYEIKERLQVRIQPSFCYGLLSVSDDDIATHLWSAGLSLGLHWQLN